MRRLLGGWVPGAGATQEEHEATAEEKGDGAQEDRKITHGQKRVSDLLLVSEALSAERL